MSEKKTMSRRKFLKVLGATAAGVTAGAALTSMGSSEKTSGSSSNQSAPAVKKPIVLNHWSWLTASDGEVWKQMIDNFNAAHKGKGMRINLQVIPFDQYDAKVLAAAAVGQAPDFGWRTASTSAKFVRDGVVIPLDDLAKKVGLDLSDFTSVSLQNARYPQYGNKLYMIPIDMMSLQMEVNVDQVNAAGLDINSPPHSVDELLKWAQALTKRDASGNVTRSGIIMTGSAIQPTVTWGIVANQMGFRRVSEDLKTAAVNPDAGIRAMEWVLDLFDKYKVSTRDITDRYKAFGTGQGSMFWTGPWTINGYLQQKLNFQTVLMPQIGSLNQHTYLEEGAQEVYTQKDTGRYEASMEAIKWLSDNSFLWTTQGRGVTPRISIYNRPDYKTAGAPWKVRGAFVEGMKNATIGYIPVVNSIDFSIYNGADSNVLARTLDLVWAKKKSPQQAMDELKAVWQKDLQQG